MMSDIMSHPFSSGLTEKNVNVVVLWLKLLRWAFLHYTSKQVCACTHTHERTHSCTCTHAQHPWQVVSPRTAPPLCHSQCPALFCLILQQTGSDVKEGWRSELKEMGLRKKVTFCFPMEDHCWRDGGKQEEDGWGDRWWGEKISVRNRQLKSCLNFLSGS